MGSRCTKTVDGFFQYWVLRPLSSAFYKFLELISQIRRIDTLIETIKQAGIKCRRHGTWVWYQPYGF